MGIETAIAGSALIGAAGSYFGNKEAAKGAEENARLQAQNRAENTKNLTPYMEAGGNALKEYMSAAGLNGSSAQAGYFSALKDDPAYSRLLDAGNESIMKRQAALGLSSNQANTLSAISDFSGQLRNQFDQQRLSQIGGIVDAGRSAATGLAGVNTQSGNIQGNALAQAGQYNGASYNALGQAANQGIQNYLNYNAYTSGRNGNNLSRSNPNA
jgi:hypothetical protein